MSRRAVRKAYGARMQATRADFMLDPGLVFLNHGSFGAVPREVFEAATQLQRDMERNPVEWLGRRSDALMQHARARLADYVGADRDDLVFFPNPTTAVNMVARSLVLEAGDEVVTTDHEYGAMDRTWKFLCADRGVRYVRVPVPLPVTTDDDFVERVWSAIGPRTKVLFLSHLTSATALVFPVAELVRRARAAGIFTIVDGAHVPAHVALDLAVLDPDVYTGALHKWLCAPKGCSFLYARRDVQPLLQPLVVSWGWESVKPTHSKFVDHQEWQGTRDLTPFLGVDAALRFAAEHDWAAMQDRCHRLVLEARGRVDALTSLEPVCPVSSTGHQWIGQMAVARLPQSTDVAGLQAALFDNHRVEVPVHRWNDQPLIRVSCAAHTDVTDIDRLVEALRVELPRWS